MTSKRIKPQNNGTRSNKFVASEVGAYIEGDLLEPMCYPDAKLFRASLEELMKDEEILKKNLLGNKATLRALAPYLQIFHKDQKRKIESAKQKLKPSHIRLEIKPRGQNINVKVDLIKDSKLISSIIDTGKQLKNIIKANRVGVYLVDHKKNELYLLPNQDWINKQGTAFKINHSTMAGYVAYIKDHVISSNLRKDSPQRLRLFDPTAKFGLGVPIKTPDDDVVAVYEFVRDEYSVVFENKDAQTVLAVTGWMGAAFLQKAIYMDVERQFEVTQCLQQLSFHYHCSLVDRDDVLSDIAIFARETVEAEYCSFYLILKTTRDYVIVEKYEQESKTILKRCSNKVITEHNASLYNVLMEKKTLNIYGSKIKQSKCAVRSMLCVPIMCSCNDIIGAIKLKNKRYEESFSADDERILSIFCSFMSIHCHYNKDYKNSQKMVLQNIAIRDMLNYHITPCTHNRAALKRKRIGYSPENFFTFSWYPSPDDMPRLAELTISMFQEVLGNQFMLGNNVPKFVLTVQNCYRPNPYHNFLHAFVVAHTMANIVNRYYYVFTGLERKGLLVAALCHDVDHRGYTNNFIQLTKHYLSNLYTSSQLENHHFAVAKMIIERCSMFSYLKPGMYDTLLKGIHDYIIATDLSLYFQCRLELMRLADERTFNFKNATNRNLVFSLIMTTCDLSGQTKPMAISRKITEDVYEEFFQQGDVEKKMGITPLPTMDRDKKDMISENQVQFLSVAVIPCIETVSRIFTLLKPVVEDTKYLLRQWKEIAEGKEQNSSAI